MKAGYGEPLRKFFADSAWVESVVDFGHAKQIFEDADVFPSIIVAKKPTESPKPTTARLCVIPREQLRIDDLSRQIATEGVELPLEQLAAEFWQLEPAGVNRLIQAIQSRGVHLSQYAGVEPYRGILTGLNEAFLITDATRAKLIKEDKRCTTLIRRNLRGQDFNRWSLAWAGYWLICIPSSENQDWPFGRGRCCGRVLAKTYPSLHRHFCRSRRL
jgi:hypothetical protein